MPFDPMPPETAADRLQRLIVALRQEMPPDFVWNFAKWMGKYECGTVGCACGLAVHLGISKSIKMDVMATALGISIADARRVFVPTPLSILWTYRVRSLNDVTPVKVAAALERLSRRYQ